MRRIAFALAAVALMLDMSSESNAQIIIQPAIPMGPFTTTTPYATGMVDNTIPPTASNGWMRRGRGFRRGGVRRRGRMQVMPPRATASPRSGNTTMGR